MKHGKRYREAAKLVDPQKIYEPQEAMELVVKGATAKFDE
ncbi:MAG TPA: 50S ribosomal protein L1, partial [Clostridia bacterium]|nr:50S ribosomal protein L1 [Clostridia bacterium]